MEGTSGQSQLLHGSLEEALAFISSDKLVGVIIPSTRMRKKDRCAFVMLRQRRDGCREGARLA